MELPSIHLEELWVTCCESDVCIKQGASLRAICARSAHVYRRLEYRMIFALQVLHHTCLIGKVAIQLLSITVFSKAIGATEDAIVGNSSAFWHWS
jgi:hypothetical protein